MAFVSRSAQRIFVQIFDGVKYERKNLRYRNCHQSSSAPPSAKPDSPLTNFEEIRIELPFAHIAGKWYGPRNIRPLVGVHGWQDNAGTFDTLAPLLPSDISFLSLDLPGHGLSSRLPKGFSYHSIDFVQLLRRLMDYFGWDKISLMGHSWSAVNSFVFAALFPDKADMIICLDALKPLTRSPTVIVDSYSRCLEALVTLEQEQRNETEKPSYMWNEIVERLYLGSNKSVNRECCKYLLLRNTQKSSDEPEKYTFLSDSRIKSALYYMVSQEVSLEMARRIVCPHLYIKALQAPYMEHKEFTNEVLTVLKLKSTFQYYEIDGTHHVHLNEPEKVSRIVNSFIRKLKM